MLNEIRKGIQLHNGISGLDVTSRLRLSEGTTRAATLGFDGCRYADQAFLPRVHWRSLNSVEVETLVSNEAPSEYHVSIGLRKIPDALLQPFHEMNLNSVTSRRDFYDLIQSPAGNLAVDAVAEYVRSLTVKAAEFRIIRIYNDPGLPTTAYVPEKDHFVGLHVDNLFQQPSTGRSQSANRISINLGRESRYLLFVNLSMDDLIDLVKPPPDCLPDDLVMSFLREAPNYPVVRLEVKPGEAYIAPTQNMVHDGVGAVEASDLNLTICGHISLRPSEKE